MATHTDPSSRSEREVERSGKRPPGRARVRLWHLAALIAVQAATVVLHETFADGRLQAAWRTFPGFSPDPLEAVRRADAPGGDGWAGLVSNRTFGGFASLSYTGTLDLDDATVEAWVYVDVVSGPQGPLQGLAVRVDPAGQRYYRLAARFNAEPSLSFAYVGRDVNNFPVILREWSPAEIPGGLPAAAGWHRMRIRAAGSQFWLWWDSVPLPGSPITDGRIPRGAVGVYATFVGGQQLAQTFVDDLIVSRETP